MSMTGAISRILDRLRGWREEFTTPARFVARTGHRATHRGSVGKFQVTIPTDYPPVYMRDPYEWIDPKVLFDD